MLAEMDFVLAFVDVCAMIGFETVGYATFQVSIAKMKKVGYVKNEE